MSTAYESCALQFPSNYVLMDTEEMEYLGGGTYYGLNISAASCQSIADGLNTHAAIVGTYDTVLTLLNLIPGLTVATGPAVLYFGVAGTALTLSSLWFSQAAKRGGAHCGYDTSKNKFVYGYGEY